MPPRRSDATLMMQKKRSRKKSPREAYAIATRAHQDSQIYNLTLDIHNLRQELYDLAMRRALLHTRSFYTRADSPVSILRVVGRYFHGFAYGYRGLDRYPEQHAFIASIADENLSLGVTGLGVDSLMDQWFLYTDLFHVHESVLSSTEILTTSESGGPSSGTVVKCMWESRGVLTRRGVDTVFPHANHDPTLLLRALGRPIRIPLLFHLYFNDAGLLVRHDAEADFLAALRDALDGDAGAAARFIHGARLGQESMILVESESSIDSPADASKSGACEEPNRVVEVSGIDGNSDAVMVTPPSPVLQHTEEDGAEVVNVVEVEEIAQNSDESPASVERHSLAFLLSPL